MYFNAHCQVFIGGNQLYTVISIEIQNDCVQLGSNCEISVPLTCKMNIKGEDIIAPVKNSFKKEDKVEIYAWYDGYEKLKVYDGFIWDFMEGTPLKIRCIDYVYWLRIGDTIKKSWGKAQFKDVCKYLCGDKIELFETAKRDNIEYNDLFVDFEVENLSFVNMSRAACLEDMKKKLGLTMSLIDNKLYCNLAEFTLNTQRLKSDVNVIHASMQKPDSAFGKIKIKMYTKETNGTKKEVEIGDADGELKEIYLYCINQKNGKTVQKLHDNALTNAKMGHYSGKIETLLYPNSNLFDAINYTDIRYPDRSAIYTVRAMNLTLDKSGFHRELTLAYLRAK